MGYRLNAHLTLRCIINHSIYEEITEGTLAKRIKIIALLLVFTLTMAISMNIISYAFFASESDWQGVGNIGTDFEPINNDPNIINVNNFYSLLNAVTDKDYNNPDKINIERKTVQLQADIELLSDLVISSDINIDFNSKTIFTNGHRIEVNHFYEGVFNLYNGTVLGIDASETIRISTPNAFIITDTLLLNQISVLIMDTDSERIFEAASTIIAESLIGGKSFTAIDGDTLLNRNRYCILHDTMQEHYNCCYINSDIDLPNSLYASGAIITYESNNPQFLSNEGKVNAAGIQEFETIILKATIEYNGSTKTFDFTLHVYDNNTHASDIAAVAEAVENLECYYYKGELADIGKVELYNITEPILVTKYAYSNGKELKYETLNADNHVIDSSTVLRGENFKTPEIAIDSGYIMTLTDAVKKLRISTVNGDFQQVIDVNGQNSQIINDNYTTALKIAKSLYGDEIVITDYKRDQELGMTDGKNYINGYTSQLLKTDVSEYASKYGVKAISYSLINNVEATYTLGADENSLQLRSINYLPNEIQKVTLKMKFEFNTEPTIVSVNIPIRYDAQSDGDGNNIAKFLPYYNYFDRLLLSVSGGSAYKDFEMPFGYGVDGAIYFYEIYDENGVRNTELVQISLRYTINQKDYVITLDEAMDLSGETISEIMLSGTGKWLISFNSDKLPVYDTSIKLRYRYKFYDYNSEWYGNESEVYESILNVKGVIKTIDMPDVNLYKYVYDCARPNKYSPQYTVDSGMLIVTSWLDNQFLNAEKISAIDLSGGKIHDLAAADSDGKTISNIKGIEYIINLELLNLASSGIITAIDIEYISKMTGLIELNLADNGLYDRTGGTLGLPSGNNNKILNKLQDLSKLEKLHLENNAFYYFNGLEGMQSLKDVCVFGNKHTSSISAFTGLLNTLYGTDGMVNRSLYGKLSSAGIIVRNVNENEGFSQLVDNDVMDKLANIEYQRKLPNGLPIENAYENLSLTPSDYGIENMGNTTWWSTQKKDDAIEYAPVGESATATKFVVRYKYYYLYGLFQSQEIILEIEMDVIRY